MYPNDDEPDDRHNRRNDNWHLDKTVNVSHILATLTAVFAAIVFGLSMDGRVNILEYLSVEQKGVDARQDSDRRQLTADIKDDLNKIDAKIDKVLQRTAP